MHMPTISPQAYCYLRHPTLSSGETMLQYTIKHLCVTGGIRLERRRRRGPVTVPTCSPTKPAAPDGKPGGSCG